MNLIIKNYKELKEKYKSVNLDQIIEDILKEYSNKKLRENPLRIWNAIIKEFILIEDIDKDYFELQKEEFDIEDCLIRNDKGKVVNLNINPLVDFLLKEHNFKTIFNKKGEIIYYYYKGIYNENGREIISLESEKLLGNFSNTFRINEILGKIKRKTIIDKIKFDNVPLELICLENGILNLITKELSPFDPEIYFKSKIPIKYDKNKTCKKIFNFIEDVCYPEDISVIQEWFGFCLYRRYFIKKAVILFGEKNTGKTVFLNILLKFLGRENTSGISLHRIASKDKFALSSLKDKYSNVYDDLSADDLNDAGGFKIATGGGYITAEYKFGDSFQFMTYAKNIFATNKIPNVKEINDDAYYERWIPICFDNQKEKEEQDNFLFENITTSDEMSGLLNWALEGLDCLLKNGKFSYDKDSREIKVIMQRQNNPIISFVEECLQQDNGNKISKETMYQVYSNWCQVKKVPRLSKEQIGRNLSKYTEYMIAKGGSERVWENVKLINTYTIDTFSHFKGKVL